LLRHIPTGQGQAQYRAVVVEAVKKLIRPLAGVNVVVCLKGEKGGKKNSRKPQKGLTGPTLLEMGG
jgi:hypothetical protein